MQRCQRRRIDERLQHAARHGAHGIARPPAVPVQPKLQTLRAGLLQSLWRGRAPRSAPAAARRQVPPQPGRKPYFCVRWSPGARGGFCTAPRQAASSNAEQVLRFTRASVSAVACGTVPTQEMGAPGGPSHTREAVVCLKKHAAARQQLTPTVCDPQQCKRGFDFVSRIAVEWPGTAARPHTCQARAGPAS